MTVIDPDSEKRIRFYEKNDFLNMDSIGYERIHMVTNELNKMDIFAWSSVYRTEQWVFDRMKESIYEVHAYKATELYQAFPTSTFIRGSMDETTREVSKNSIISISQYLLLI